MKIRYAFVASLMIATVWAAAQQVQSGGLIRLLGPTTLTSSYVATTNIDLQSYDSCTLIITVPTSQAAANGKVKPQWSSDGTTFYDEPVLSAGTTSGGETPFTISSRVYAIDMSNPTNTFVDRTRRLSRYFRCSISSTNVTTGTLQIDVKPENNQN
jgi:hypothetical protein